MTELEDLMGVWGAVDQQVVANPEAIIGDELLADIVGRYLGPYRDGAAGWFGEFTAWTTELTGVDAAEQYPGLGDALRNLAETEPRGRRLARRLHVIAVAARIFPDLQDTGHPFHEDLVRALTMPHLAPDVDAGEQLLRLLCDDEIFPGLGAWEPMLLMAGEQGLVDDVMLRQATASPCSGELVLVTLPNGDIDPVPTLRTHFCTTALTLAQAKRFLDPVNWPDCNDFWCEMTLTGTSSRGNRTYHERVSLACNTSAWEAATDLEFAMVNLPGSGALVSYNLCEGLPQPGDMILVDSGSLLVVQNGNDVCVTTTKRILFDHPFSGPSLAVLACVLGYGAVAEDLVFTCALEAGNPNASPGTEFPGVDPPNASDQGGRVMASQPSTASEDEGECDSVKAVIDDAVDAAKDCLDDCVEAYQKSYDKVRDGEYKAADAAEDMAAMWARLIRDGGMAIDLGLRATRAAGRARTPTKRQTVTASADVAEE